MAALNSNFTDYDRYLEINSTFGNRTEVYSANNIFDVLNIYYTPVLVALGTIGNLISITVFYASKLRIQSTSHYLSALAVSDTVFLFQLLPPWLNALDITGVFYRPWFCQIFVYMSYVTCCLSAWLVVAFTMERFLAVLYPLRRNAVCTPKRARYVVCGLAVAALVLNIPVLRFAIPKNGDCNIDLNYKEYAEKFNLMDTLLSFTTPFFVILVLNTSIVSLIYRLANAREIMTRSQLGGMSARAAAAASQSARSQQRITRMLLIVSSVFVILNLPAYTMRILAYAYDMSDEEESGRWSACQQIALMFFNTNFGINFILYCLSGQNFRRTLRQTMPWLNCRKRRAATDRHAASAHPGRASSVSTSFVSNCTEPQVNCPSCALTGRTPLSRRRRRENVISRWTFDNSRQRQHLPNQQAGASNAGQNPSLPRSQTGRTQQNPAQPSVANGCPHVQSPQPHTNRRRGCRRHHSEQFEMRVFPPSNKN